MFSTSHLSADEQVLAFEDRRISRGELDVLTANFAAALDTRGIRQGDRVALMSSNRPEFVVALRAIWRLGASVVLIGTLAWFAAELGGDRVGLAERFAAGAQALWPLVVVLSSRAARRG